MNCPSCQAPVHPGDAFCDNCGHALSGQLQTPSTWSSPPPGNSCPHCHTPVMAGEAFCGACGASLNRTQGTGPSQNAPTVIVSSSSVYGEFSGQGAFPASPGGQPQGDATCTHCYSPLAPGSLFCDNCGAPVASDRPQQSSPPPSQPPAPQWQSNPPSQPPAPQWQPDPPSQPVNQQWQQTPDTQIWPPDPPSQPVNQQWQQTPDTQIWQPDPPSQPVNQQWPPTTPSSNPPAAAATLRLVVKDSNTSLSIPEGQAESIIGREDPVSGHFPDINLGPHGGEEGGVSRSHAKLITQGGQCFLEDLQSVNFTHVNKQRLNPGIRQPLNHGDELRFGKVVLTFYTV